MSQHYTFVELISAATESLPNNKRIPALRAVVAQTADQEIAAHFTAIADELARTEHNCRQLHLNFCGGGGNAR